MLDGYGKLQSIKPNLIWSYLYNQYLLQNHYILFIKLYIIYMIKIFLLTKFSNKKTKYI